MARRRLSRRNRSNIGTGLASASFYIIENRSAPMQKTLNDLFLTQLKDIYFAEKQIYKTLPKMAKVTKIPELKQAFTHHREETQGHIVRLEQVFEMIGKRPQAKQCEAIQGIISEGEETIEEFGDSEALDAGL